MKQLESFSLSDSSLMNSTVSTFQYLFSQSSTDTARRSNFYTIELMVQLRLIPFASVKHFQLLCPSQWDIENYVVLFFLHVPLFIYLIDINFSWAYIMYCVNSQIVLWALPLDSNWQKNAIVLPSKQADHRILMRSVRNLMYSDTGQAECVSSWQ